MRRRTGDSEMRKIIGAVAFAAMASAASAEIRPGEEELTRCIVDLEIAFEFLAPATNDEQTPEDRVALLAPERAAVAEEMLLGFRTLQETYFGWTHHTGADSERLGAVEQAEEDELVALVAAARDDDAAIDRMLDTIFERAEACLERFLN